MRITHEGHSTSSTEVAISRLYRYICHLQPQDWSEIEMAFTGFYIDMRFDDEFEGELVKSLKTAIENFRDAFRDGSSKHFIFNVYDTMEKMLNLADNYMVAHREDGETDAIQIVAGQAGFKISELAEGNRLWISWFDDKGEYKPANYFRDVRAEKESKAAEAKLPPKPPQEPPQGGTPSSVISIETGVKATARKAWTSPAALWPIAALMMAVLIAGYGTGSLWHRLGFVVLLACAIGVTSRLARATAKTTSPTAHATN